MITITNELFKKAQKGEKNAVEEFFRIIFGVLIKTEITSSLKSEGEENDVALITLTKIFKNLSGYEFKSPEEFTGWVHKIHRNSAKDWFRKKTRLSSGRARHFLFDPPETSKGPKDFVTRDLCRTVWRFLRDNESPETGQMLLLSATGYTDLEISRRFKKPIGTIKARMRRARKRIREHLNS